MNYVNSFCTPPYHPVTEYDHKVLAGATRAEFEFEGHPISCYMWGKGKPLLLVHGWGSRASHLALPGRLIAGEGFRVIAFDAPAHSSLSDNGRKGTSSFFEFCRVIVALSKKYGPFHAIVGHSLGAISSLFAVTGHPFISTQKAITEKLVMISLPVSIGQLVIHFSRQLGLNDTGCQELKLELEREFRFSIEDFTACSVIKNAGTDMLIIHDKDDEVFPVKDIYQLKKICPEADRHLTSGLGHQRILANRQVMAKIKDYLN